MFKLPLFVFKHQDPTLGDEKAGAFEDFAMPKEEMDL